MQMWMMPYKFIITNTFNCHRHVTLMSIGTLVIYKFGALITVLGTSELKKDVKIYRDLFVMMYRDIKFSFFVKQTVELMFALFFQFIFV